MQGNKKADKRTDSILIFLLTAPAEIWETVFVLSLAVWEIAGILAAVRAGWIIHVSIELPVVEGGINTKEALLCLERGNADLFRKDATFRFSAFGR